MPRIRSLKPEHRQHRKTGPLTDRQYRLWVGMLLEADDEGRLVADAGQLRILIWGYHPKVTVQQVADAMKTLDEVGLIHIYTMGNIHYAEFPSWHDHQRIDRPQPSKLPESQRSQNARRAFVEHSSSIRRTIDEHSTSIRADRKGSEGKGTDRRGKEGSLREGKPDGQNLTMSEPGKISNGHGGVFADTLAAIKLRHPELNDPDAEAEALRQIESDARGRTR